MKSNNFTLFKQLLLFIFIIFNFGFSSEILKKCEFIIQSSILNIDSLSHGVFTIPSTIMKKIENESKQRFFKPNVHYWIISKNESTINYAILDNVIGKSMPITFIVLFNQNGTILKSEIIKYREPYGGEISGKNWLKQFIAKSSSSQFKVGKNIDGISGATISVNSVTKGIKKLSFLFPHLIESNK
jgi:Na+-translocating ferredoxin:NAD+ oxidoreductase RnfG subunit